MEHLGMVELKFGPRTVDLPYTVRVAGVTEEMFDDLVDEDTKAELIDGVMVVHSPTSLRHDDIGGFLRLLMRMYAARKHLGKVLGPDSLVHLATCRKLAPDIFYIEKKRVPRRWPRAQFEGAPNNVVDVLSPSNRTEDLEDKRPAYQQARVDEIWFVDPDACEVIVDRRIKRSYTSSILTSGRLASTVLKGYWLDVAWLWAEPLPNEWECLQEILAGAPG
jgi:Uma2 family endonuclease